MRRVARQIYRVVALVIVLGVGEQRSDWRHGHRHQVRSPRVIDRDTGVDDVAVDVGVRCRGAARIHGLRIEAGEGGVGADSVGGASFTAKVEHDRGGGVVGQSRGGKAGTRGPEGIARVIRHPAGADVDHA